MCEGLVAVGGWSGGKRLTVVDSVDARCGGRCARLLPRKGGCSSNHTRRTRSALSMSKTISITSHLRLFHRGALYDFLAAATSASTLPATSLASSSHFLQARASSYSSATPIIMDQLRSSDAVKALDPYRVAEEVHSLAASDKPIAPLVSEALQVINEALDTHGCVHCALHWLQRQLSMLKTGPRQP